MKFKLIILTVTLFSSLVIAKDTKFTCEPKGSDNCEPDKIYLDCDNNGRFTNGLDRIIESDDIFRDHGTRSVLKSPPTIPGCEEAGVVFPKKAKVKGHQLDVTVNGDIRVRTRMSVAWFASGLFPKEILNDGIHNIAFVYGVIKLHSLKGSIFLEDESFSVNVGGYDLSAAKDIVFGDNTRIAQFKAGYLEPEIMEYPYGPLDYYYYRRRGPQYVSAGGNITFGAKAALDSSDQLLVLAGGDITVGDKAYFRGRNEFCLKSERGHIKFGKDASILADHVSFQSPSQIDISQAKLDGTIQQCHIGNADLWDLPLSVGRCLPYPIAVTLNSPIVSSFGPPLGKLRGFKASDIQIPGKLEDDMCVKLINRRNENRNRPEKVRPWPFPYPLE